MVSEYSWWSKLVSFLYIYCVKIQLMLWARWTRTMKTSGEKQIRSPWGDISIRCGYELIYWAHELCFSRSTWWLGLYFKMSDSEKVIKDHCGKRNFNMQMNDENIPRYFHLGRTQWHHNMDIQSVPERSLKENRIFQQFPPKYWLDVNSFPQRNKPSAQFTQIMATI